MHYRWITLVSVLALCLGCGKGYQFNNPVDPACQDNSNSSACTTSSTQATSGGDSGSPTSGGTNTSTSSPSSNLSGTVYNFVNSFNVTPTGCSGVGKVQVFDNGSDLMIFFLATCSSRPHVYAYRASYAGVASTSPAMMTSDCNTGTTGITDFAADKGPDTYLLAYVCGVSSSSYVTKVMTVSKSVVAGLSATYETSTQAYPYQLAWNSSSNTFGLAGAGAFQRFNQSGGAAGGPVTLSDTAYPNVFQVVDGQWLMTDYNNKLTTISSSGAVGCNVDAGFTSSTLLFSGSDQVVEIWSDGSIAAQHIVPTTCLPTGAVSTTARLTNQGTAYKIRGGLLLSSSIGSTLFSNGKAVILATYSRSDPFTLYAENSVVGFSTNLSRAEYKTIQNKIYVTCAKDGVGYVTYSTESVP